MDADIDFVHTGPGTLAGRYLRRFWQPIHRVHDLAPGRALPVRVMGEDFTLYRGEAGPNPSPLPGGEGTNPHLLAFRCAHRGTQLSTGWVEGDDIRCFYHGWKYGPNGQCMDQPAEPEPFCARIQIRSYPVEEYIGLVFAYLGEGTPPSLPRYPDFETERDPRVQAAWPCNYFVRLESIRDEWRIGPVDQGFAGMADIRQIEAEETDSGLLQRGIRSHDDVTVGYVHMPNVHQFTVCGSPPDQSGNGSWESLLWIVPVDDEHFTTFNVTRAARGDESSASYQERRAARAGNIARRKPAEELGEEILAGRLRLADVTDRTMNLNVVQDYVAIVGQSRVADRAGENLGAQDASVALLRSIWERELRALAHDEPLKQWERRVAVRAGKTAAASPEKGSEGC
ncbi:MAG: hypothetical protein HW416_408 [Chloroflexi bacterium]|nr:hypothetical protein [Chloroflexota bacterium]